MNKYLILIACMMLFYSCSEENNREPVTSDSTIPGKVTNVGIERLPGAVKLTYDLPDGENLSYVKAECLINGVVRQAKASSYINRLTLEGFADTSVYTIRLYSVNRSEKASDPVEVQVKPLNPNFREVFQGIVFEEDWGGAVVRYKNPNEADLAICITYIDNTGFWNSGETFYTKKIDGYAALRDLKPVETTFGAYIRDRWGNATDTLFKVLTPKSEQQLDRLKFRLLDVPGTCTWNIQAGLRPEYAWDGDFGKIAVQALNPLHISSVDGKWPHWFVLDLGVEALFSRFKLWQRGTTFAYADRNVKKFELWGSMNPPGTDGAFDESWKLLMDEEMIKPSGFPPGQNSDDDINVLIDGHEFIFPPDVPRVRYIRFLCKETWGMQFCYFMMQIAFWGDPSNIE